MGSSYRDLIVWQRAKTLAVSVYRATEPFPKSELYGLTSQMRRAGISVASNIAEGQGRTTPGEFVQFLGHARGSLLELQTQAEVAIELEFLTRNSGADLLRDCGEVLFLLNRLMNSLTGKSKTNMRSSN